MRGGGTTTASNPTSVAKRRKAVIISVLIEHPTEGLILFETGGGENYPEGEPIAQMIVQTKLTFQQFGVHHSTTSLLA